MLLHQWLACTFYTIRCNRPHPRASGPFGSRGLGISKVEPHEYCHLGYTVGRRADVFDLDLDRALSESNGKEYDWNPHFWWIRFAPAAFDSLDNFLSFLPAFAQHVL